MTTSNEIEKALERIYEYTKNINGCGINFWSEKTQNTMLSRYRDKAAYWQKEWYRFLCENASENTINFIIGTFCEFDSFNDFERKIIELSNKI